MFYHLWNCNRLWKVWYVILITLIQGYVIFNAIRQYIIFKIQFYDPRYGGEWDLVPLHFYVACIIVSISLMGFFVYFSLVNEHNESYVSHLLERQMRHSSLRDMAKSVLKLIQKRLPYSHILHFVIAICLLLPLPVIQMEEIRNEALSPDSIWTVDLDFFSDHFNWFKATSLPNAAVLRNIHYITKSTSLSVEFINFSIAMILILIKMPTIFWSSHKCFSAIFSVLIFSNSIGWIFVFEAGSIIIKCPQSTGLATFSREMSSHIHYPTMLLFVVIHFLLTLSGFVLIFAYGCTQTLFSCVARVNSFEPHDTSSMKRRCWLATVLALGFSSLIFSLVLNSILYSLFFRYFQSSRKTIFMIAIIFGTVNLVLNFLTWFTFAIKTKWVFNPHPCVVTDKHEEGYKLASSSDPTYGCFHNNVTMSSSSSQSGTVRTVEGNTSDCSGHGNNFQNYIYAQTNAMQIPTISEVYDENPIHFQSGTQPRGKISVSSFDDSNSQSRGMTSTSDNGICQSIENINSDSYRSLQMYGGRRSGKLVKFQGMEEDGSPMLGFYEGRFSANDFEEKQLNFLKVPDILKVNRSNLVSSHSESSLDKISSSASSKVTVDHIDQGLCSEV